MGNLATLWKSSWESRRDWQSSGAGACFRQTILRSMRLGEIFMKLLGPLLLGLALTLYCFVTCTWFYYILPRLEVDPLRQGALVSVALCLLTNMVYNHLSASCIGPGCPPEFPPPEVPEVVGALSTSELQPLKDEEIEMSLSSGTVALTSAAAEKERAATVEKERAAATGAAAAAVAAAYKPRMKRCKRCNRQKPSRCHHCSICNRCVLKMDHHCPWINNCVGYVNHRHFCLFLMYLFSCCVFVVCTSMVPFNDANFRWRRTQGMTRNARQCISMAFILCVAIMIALCLLGGFQVFLVLTNQTTIEFQSNWVEWVRARKAKKPWQNPYDLGFAQNFQQVFGASPFCRLRWLVPWMGVPLLGDGLSFPEVPRNNA